MTETGADITENDDAVSLREYIRGHADHLDAGLHALQQQANRIEQHLETLTAELAEAKPLLDKWRKSRVAKLVAGEMPWG